MTTKNHAERDTFKGENSPLICPQCQSTEIGMAMDNDSKRSRALVYRYYCQSCGHSTKWLPAPAKALSAWEKLCRSASKKG